MKVEVSKLIQEFSGKFLEEIKQPYHATPNTRVITENLPAAIGVVLGLDNGYKIYGSVGSGNWSEIPWLAILDRSVCESTTQGYYVVILFDKSLQSIYLCLSVGWTQFEDEYGIKDGKLKIRAACKHYAKLLDAKLKGFKDGEINLNANNNLGKGYEVGAIISKKYLVAQLSDEELLNDMRQLISAYLELKSVVGDSILNLEIDSSEGSEDLNTFKKKVATESFSKDTAGAIARLVEAANAAPPEVRERLKKEIVRNRKFANLVKERAHYICQVCGCGPFIQINGKPYAEADHINPLGGTTRGLDSPDNMRCLCAQCHAILTHGSDQEIKNLLLKNV